MALATTSQQEPQLTVISDGAGRGRVYQLRRGNQIVGRDPSADLVVDAPQLSRCHAYLSWDGAVARVLDAGSTNGTTVNGERVGGEWVLKPGDVISFGGLMMRFEGPTAEATAEHTQVGPGVGFRNAFGGPNYGDVNQAGRDLTIRSWNDYRIEEYDPSQELFQGRGPGRVLMVVGSIVALCGFAGWAYVILGSGASSSGPFDMKIGSLPLAVVSFAAFLVGGVLAGIGQGMSKAARAREEAALRRSGRW